VEELVSEFTARDPVDGFMSCLIAILYFGTIYALEGIGQSILFRPWFREILADYAYPVCFPTLSTTGLCQLLTVGTQIGTIFWVGFSHIPGPLKSTNISVLPITRAFYPTQPRGWLVDFWTLDVKWIFVALPFGFLLMLLFYYDHVRIKIQRRFHCDY